MILIMKNDFSYINDYKYKVTSFWYFPLDDDILGQKHTCTRHTHFIDLTAINWN